MFTFGHCPNTENTNTHIYFEWSLASSTNAVHAIKCQLEHAMALFIIIIRVYVVNRLKFSTFECQIFIWEQMLQIKRCLPGSSLGAKVMRKLDQQNLFFCLIVSTKPFKNEFQNPRLAPELRNVNYLSQIKSFKPIFSPRRACKSRQIQRLSRMKLR